MSGEGLDGVSQWSILSEGNSGRYGAREEVVYNIKEKPFMAGLRHRDFKLIWGSRTQKNVWFKVEEEPIDEEECREVKKRRTNYTSASDKSVSISCIY